MTQKVATSETESNLFSLDKDDSIEKPERKGPFSFLASSMLRIKGMLRVYFVM